MTRVLALLVVTASLVACTGDRSTSSDNAPVTATEDAAEQDDQDAAESSAADSAGDDATQDDPGTVEDGLEQGESGVLVQFRGEQLTGGPDSTAWSCATSADGEFAAFGLLDEAGNDISVNHDANAETDATLTLADGSNWNATEGGVVNVSAQSDGAIRMSIQLTETTTGESESADIRLMC